jgi:hypothetical protein
MLAEASPLVAILFIAGAVGLVATVILIGLRQRLELEIPPHTWPEPPPMTATERRAYIGLFGVGMVFWGVAVVGAFLDARWLVVLGMSLFLAAFLARVGITFRRAMRIRRAYRARSEGP